jgi:hypothetical protein
MPDLPTVAAAGLPGFESVVLQGMFAPAGTPPARVTLLSREIAKVLNRPDVKERHFNTGVETVASTPEELVAHSSRLNCEKLCNCVTRIRREMKPSFPRRRESRMKKLDPRLRGDD